MNEESLYTTCLQLASSASYEVFRLKEELEQSRGRDASLFISRRRALILSEQLLDAKGFLDGASIEKWIEKLSREGLPFSPYTEEILSPHFLSILKALKNKEMALLLQRFFLPVCHPFAENLVRFSVHGKGKIDNRDLKIAVLSALFTPLRQTVGSCFATAPAILVQKENPKQLMQDLYDLLFTSKLQRTFGGVQYAVPMSFMQKIRPEQEHPLLKMWEFTVASFSEVKMEFSKWNFAISLGFSHEEKGGLGQILVQELQCEVDEINREIEKHQREYALAFDQARATEILVKNAGSSLEARRLVSEYQSRVYHMNACLKIREEWEEKGSHFSSLFSILLQGYIEQFPFYFQEVYDPDIQEEKYEDSPAGFRLVYKHGRQDPNLWTVIREGKEYISCLSDFFVLVEPEIKALCPWKGGAELIGHLTSKMLLHLQDPLFLQSAMDRMKKEGKKPWFYVSGGTMTTLVQTYFRIEKELLKEEKWVASPEELVVFILDTLKNLPPKITDHVKSGMLMNSPSHAFLLLADKIKRGWEGNTFTYTWVRDHIVTPSEIFYREMKLSREEQRFLSDKLGIPDISSSYSISPEEWGKQALSFVKEDRLSSFLYESLPVIPKEKMEDLLSSFLAELGVHSYAELKTAPFLTADSFHTLVKQLYIQASGELREDLHEQVMHIGKKKGTVQPGSFLFADTNWPSNYFAFVVNPLKLKLDLFRVSYALQKGVPMSSWKQWMNGQDKKPWCIFLESYGLY
ncbi:MAG: hypothetical protein RLZZ453_846 [Chlamydiota bacterium]|jgi:hypothetical protein